MINSTEDAELRCLTLTSVFIYTNKGEAGCSIPYRCLMLIT